MLESTESYIDQEDTQDRSGPPPTVERIGNNRYHQPKYVAKAKRKAAKVSKRRNRGK